ncbi:hypothetical protein PRJ39_15240 [Lysobacter enzymogenes]|uniref:hypothetical protein n=1 Tax=Lysobacter enzymogenes TaxID=69 RepID=UPI003747F85F
MATVLPSRPRSTLRRALALDAAASAAAGALLLGFTAAASRHFAMAPGLILAEAAIMFAWALFVGWAASRDPVAPALAWTAIAVNFAWGALSVLALVVGALAPTALGTELMLAQALGVAVLGAMQYAGLRQQQRG